MITGSQSLLTLPVIASGSGTDTFSISFPASASTCTEIVAGADGYDTTAADNGGTGYDLTGGDVSGVALALTRTASGGGGGGGGGCNTAGPAPGDPLWPDVFWIALLTAILLLRRRTSIRR